MRKYLSVSEFEHAEAQKPRSSGFRALGHLDPATSLLNGGYGLNGPGKLSLEDAVALMLQRSTAGDRLVRGVRVVATWTERESEGRPRGSFSYSFIYASEEEQSFLRPFRANPSHRL